jgi:crossover junction endonuclease MUS81
MSLPEKSIVQADVNTQLIDELLVHHATDPKDSANYLIQMTNYVTEKYKNLTLNCINKTDLDKILKSTNDNSNFMSSRYVISFQEFNQFSNKNKPLTIREMFAKLLMKIQGVSQEKCLPIIELYPTPAL